MNGTILKLGISLLLALTMASGALAQEETKAPPIIPAQPENSEDTSNVSETLIIPHSTEGAKAGAYFQSVYLPEITRVVISIAGAAAFLFIIIGGIQILTAYGDEEKITSAKKTIEYAILGLVISILSYAIVSIISGVQITQVTEQGPAPGTEDMTQEEMEDPGRYGEGSLTQEEILGPSEE